MGTFARGLSDSFVAELNRRYDQGGWVKAIMDDKDLFVAIRDESVNVYYHGTSLVRLERVENALVGATHYKYLVREDVSPQYVRSYDGTLELEESSRAYLTASLDDLAALKKAAKNYIGEEKRGVGQILRCNANVVDVEVGLVSEGSADQGDQPGRRSTQRLDLAAVRATAHGAELFFVEAKLYVNSEVRAKDIPRVLGQIKRYEHLLARREDEVRSSYLRVCQNLLDLKGRGPARCHVAARAAISAGSSLRISAQPRLAIFGFDRDQRDSKVWAGHRAKLEAAIGKERLLVRGNADGFTRGIST